MTHESNTGSHIAKGYITCIRNFAYFQAYIPIRETGQTHKTTG